MQLKNSSGKGGQFGMNGRELSALNIKGLTRKYLIRIGMHCIQWVHFREEGNDQKPFRESASSFGIQIR